MAKINNDVQDWLEFAEQDLHTATLLYKEEVYNHTCFHSQQCVEKLFKAALKAKGNATPKVHNLLELFNDVVQSGYIHLLSFRPAITKLNLCYVPTRYPDAAAGALPHRFPNEKDAKEALETAEEIYKILMKTIK